ncbi:hypothetical protein [Sphingobium xenophagum]|nr:hypothetical protein [Sphingobium xenophagum]
MHLDRASGIEPCANLAVDSIPRLTAPAAQEAHHWSEVFVERLGIGRANSGMALQTNVVRIVMGGPFQLGGCGVAGTPAGALDYHLEHVSAHGEPPRNKENPNGARKVKYRRN